MRLIKWTIKDFLTFMEVENLTGAGMAKQIMETIASHGIDPNLIVNG